MQENNTYKVAVIASGLPPLEHGTVNLDDKGINEHIANLGTFGAHFKDEDGAGYMFIPATNILQVVARRETLVATLGNTKRIITP